MNSSLKNLLTALAAAQKAQNDELYVGKGDKVSNADYADNLTSQIGSLDTTPFIRRPTGGNSDVRTGEQGAALKELRGNTVLFNQLARELTSDNYTADNAYTFSDNTATVTLDSSGVDAEKVGRLQSSANKTFKLKANHTYYSRVTLTFSGEVTSYFIMQLRYGSSSSNESVFKLIDEYRVPLFTSVANTPITIEDIRTAPSEVDNTYTRLRLALVERDGSAITYTDGTTLTYSDINIIDLTEMFGAGNEPTTISAFKKTFNSSYYAYNEGQLLNAKATSVKSYSANLYVGGENFSVIGGEDYAISGENIAWITEYDVNGNTIKTTVYSALGTVYSLDNTAHAGYVNSDIKGIRLDENTVAVNIFAVFGVNIYFGLAWSKPYTGDTTHRVETYALGGEELRSVGSSYDTQTPDGLITRRVRVLNNVTGSAGDTIELPSSKIDTAIISDKGRDLLTFSSVGIMTNYYTLNYDVENATIYYEFLYAAISPYPTEQGTPYTEKQYCNDYGIQVFEGTAAPQGAEFFYQANLSDFIQRTYSRVDGNPAEIVKQSELSSALANFVSKLATVTDLTSTSKIVTLATNTRYNFSELTALDITFPSTANDGDVIEINFISGSTATTLTRDTTNAIYNFSSIGAGAFIEFNAEYKASVGKWVVLSAETATS